MHVCQVTPAAAAAAKSLQSCPTLCDPRDGSPPGSSIPGILQARTLEWVAISFSNAWKWKVKVKVKSLSRVQLFATPWTAAYQAPPSVGFFQARVLEWGAIAFSVPSLCISVYTPSSSLSRYSGKSRHLRKLPQHSSPPTWASSLGSTLFMRLRCLPEVDSLPRCGLILLAKVIGSDKLI